MNTSPQLKIVALDEQEAETIAKANEFCDLCEGVDPVWVYLTLDELEERILPINNNFPDAIKRLAELWGKMGGKEFELLQEFNEQTAAMVAEEEARHANDV